RASRLHRGTRHGVPRHRFGGWRALHPASGWAEGLHQGRERTHARLRRLPRNRQYITLGNLSENDRAYLFLIDFSRRQRIKLWGRARAVENNDALIERLFDHGYQARPERVILFTIEAWDVNCSQHITARLTADEVEGLLG